MPQELNVPFIIRRELKFLVMLNTRVVCLSVTAGCLETVLDEQAEMSVDSVLSHAKRASLKVQTWQNTRAISKVTEGLLQFSQIRISCTPTSYPTSKDRRCYH